jgi:hypothetical protein
MATIYRFIVEEKQGNANTATTANGVAVPRNGAGNKGFNLGGMFGGTEHNRFMRPINSVMNRVTGGVWEKGTRLVRAGGNVMNAGANGGLAGILGSVGFAIIVQFLVIEMMKMFEQEKKKAREENQSNFLKIKTGQTVLGPDYKINKDIFGRITYSNQ